MTIPLVIGVNPLQTTWLERGIVSGRVALLLRSAEIHPLFERFVRWTMSILPSSSWLAMTLGGAGAQVQSGAAKSQGAQQHQLSVRSL